LKKDSSRNAASSKKNQWIVNSYIRAANVICIDPDGKNAGVMPTSKALKLAQDSELDLVQLPGKDDQVTPTCRIMNFGKFKYEQDLKRKEEERKQREQIVKTKEIKLKPGIGFHDVELKAEQAQKFIEDGCKVKVSVSLSRKHDRQPDKVIRQLIQDTFGDFWNLIQGGIIEQSDNLGRSSSSFLIKKGDTK